MKLNPGMGAGNQSYHLSHKQGKIHEVHKIYSQDIRAPSGKRNAAAAASASGGGGLGGVKSNSSVAAALPSASYSTKKIAHANTVKSQRLGFPQIDSASGYVEMENLQGDDSEQEEKLIHS